MKKTRATMRLQLLKRLQEEGLGLRQIELFVQNEAKYRLSDKFKSKSTRSVGQIDGIMRNRIKDAYEAVRETTQAKSMMVKKLSKVFKKQVKLGERIFNQLGMEERKTINMIQRKNNNKVNHLREKFSNNSEPPPTIPDILARYKDIKIFHETINEESNVDINVMTIGDIELDEEELSILKLPPDFAILTNLSEENFIHEEELAMTKLRWEKRKVIEEDLGKDNIDVTEEEKEEIKIVEAKSRQIFDPINKSLDLRKRRVTDLKENFPCLSSQTTPFT